MFGSETADFPTIDFGDSGLEDRLSVIPPGAGLAAVLAGIDRADLGHYDRVALLQARARLLSHMQAELYADMVAVGDAIAEAIGGHESEFEADEIRAALVLTRSAAENQMTTARALIERFPHLWQALWSGLLDAARVRVILDAIAGLKMETAAQLLDNLLSEAPDLTTGQLRARLGKMVITVDPDDAVSRYQQGVECRRIVPQPNPDGTAGLLGLDLPADQAAAAMNHICQLAR